MSLVFAAGRTQSPHAQEHEHKWAVQTLTDLETELTDRIRKKRLAIAAVKLQERAIATHRRKCRENGIDL